MKPVRMGLALSLALACSRSSENPRFDAVQSFLTAAQCNAFSVSGKTQVCHATGSARHPYTVLKIDEAACINAHADHPGDYIAVGDPTCHGGGCLPAAAPCDATVPCCDGMSCKHGTCVTCLADDAAVCTAAGLTAGACNDCCFGNARCGSSGYPPGNECGTAAGFGCTNAEQNAACVTAILESGCSSQCGLCPTVCISDAKTICTLAGLTAGACNDCCFAHANCGSSGYPPGNECGTAAGFGCSNDEQNTACANAIAAAGCSAACSLCQ